MDAYICDTSFANMANLTDLRFSESHRLPVSGRVLCRLGPSAYTGAIVTY